MIKFKVPEIDDQALKRLFESRGFKTCSRAMAVVCVSVLAATGLTSFLFVKLSDAATPSRQSGGSEIVPEQIEKFNYRNLRKSILDRNLFNSDGEFPTEAEPGEAGAQNKGEQFNINAPCQETKLNITLVGTIYTGYDQTSLVTIQEKGVEGTDVYRIGDVIIGNDAASVARVERKKVIINNAGVKECIELADPKLNQGSSTSSLPGIDEIPAPNADRGGVLEPANPAPAVNSDGGNVTLDCSFIESEIGPGFSKILSSVRMVPNPAGAGINGFKVFAIRSGSLFDKIGLQNGDVVQQVNDTNLSQPDQGFALFQSLQDEEVVRIKALRQGDTPVTLTVNCK